MTTEAEGQTIEAENGDRPSDAGLISHETLASQALTEGEQVPGVGEEEPEDGSEGIGDPQTVGLAEAGRGGPRARRAAAGARGLVARHPNASANEVS